MLIGNLNFFSVILFGPICSAAVLTGTVQGELLLTPTEKRENISLAFNKTTHSIPWDSEHSWDSAVPPGISAGAPGVAGNKHSLSRVNKTIFNEELLHNGIFFKGLLDVNVGV